MPQCRAGGAGGKLKKAARAWATGRGGMTRRMADPMTQAALMPEWMKARLAGTEAAPGEVRIAPDEVAALGLFLSLGTQWRWCPLSGRRLGLDYAAIEPAARLQAIETNPRLFRDLRLMEQAALDAFGERVK